MRKRSRLNTLLGVGCAIALAAPQLLSAQNAPKKKYTTGEVQTVPADPKPLAPPAERPVPPPMVEPQQPPPLPPPPPEPTAAGPRKYTTGDTQTLPTPPRLSQSTISLDQALALSLTYDPNVEFASTRRLSEQGAYQVESGFFDPTVTGSILGAYDRAELLPSGIRQQKGQRLLFSKLATEFQKVADRLRENLAANPNSRTFLACDDPANAGLFTEGTEVIITDPTTGRTTVLTCSTAAEIEQQKADDALLQELINNSDGKGREALLAAQANNQNLAAAAIEEIIAILDQQAREQRQRDRLIGQTPTIEVGRRLQITLGVRKPFRSGIAVTPLFSFQRTEKHNVGKGTTKPNTGGRATFDTYRAALALQIEAPLLRNSGYLAVTGPERAARLGVIASEAEFHQSEASSAFRAAAAYWNLVAAQQRMSLAEESLSRQDKLNGIARSLASADEIAPVDLLSVDARVADARASLSRSRNDLASARVQLARTIGLSVLKLSDAPLASDDFPAMADADRIAAVASEPLVSAALDARFDTLAAAKRLDASRILIETARSGLRPRLDLDFTIGYLGFKEDQNVGKGIKGALFGNWVGPSIILGLNYELPFGNNVALGQLQQAYSLANQAEINQTNLNRIVGTGVVDALLALRDAASTVDKGERAVRLYRTTIDNEFTKYRAGESTLIDYILTEENLTASLASLISARQSYATALARLRFELGHLVTYGPTGATVDATQLRQLPF